jgi:hypothetical protein
VSDERSARGGDGVEPPSFYLKISAAALTWIEQEPEQTIADRGAIDGSGKSGRRGKKEPSPGR